MSRFEKLNQNKTYDEMIKPFSFMLVGFSTDKNINPIAPFIKNPQEVVYSDFIDYKSGAVMHGEEHFKTLEDELWHYLIKPEAKLDGDIGIMKRRHVIADRFSYVGKEAEKIEENSGGLSNVDIELSYDPKEIEGIVLSSMWEDIRPCGIPKSQFYALKKQLKQGKRLKLSSKTLRRLNSLDLGNNNDNTNYG